MISNGHHLQHIGCLLNKTPTWRI